MAEIVAEGFLWLLSLRGSAERTWGGW
jgi:hypothetical protein